jgi:hypothetical protein
LGSIQIDAGTAVASDGALALTAKTGITLADLTSQTQVDLYTESGTVLAASSVLPDDGSHVTAPAVSVHGYGASVGSADVSRVLLVDSDMLRVTAPHGLVSRGLLSSGQAYYRLMDAGHAYFQAKVVGDLSSLPERVLTTQAVVKAQATAFMASNSPAEWIQAGSWSSMGRSGLVFVSPSQFSSSPVNTMLAPHWFTDTDPQAENSLAIDSLGFEPKTAFDSSSSSLDAPMLRSTGQLLAVTDWSIDMVG